MNRYVTDTHALLWHLSQDSALSSEAARLFNDADRGQVTIVIPTIVIVEITYLCERQRVPFEQIKRILSLVQLPNSQYHSAPLDLSVAEELQRVARDLVPDMPDRIIAATALHLGLPLITRDSKLQTCSLVTCIW